MNADDPKFTAHALGEAEDLTPAERAEIEAFIASNSAAAAEAAETKALATRLRAELQGEVAPALDEKQRATVLRAMAESGAKTKVIPIRRRTKVLAAIAACLTVGVLSAVLLQPGYFRNPRNNRVEAPTRHLADLPSGTATRDTGSVAKFTGTAAPAPSETKAEVPVGQTLALNGGNPVPGAVAADSVSPPSAGGKVEGKQSPEEAQTKRTTSREHEALDQLGKIAEVEGKTASSLRRSAGAVALESELPLPAKDASGKALTEKDLLKKIDAINSGLAQTATAAPAPALPASSASLENPLLDLTKSVSEPSKDLIAKAITAESPGVAGIIPEAANGTMIGSGVASDSAEAKPKQPTVIDALDSKFDQEANQAVFVGEVVVQDPEFNVWCDKLTAFMKHDEKNGKGGKVAAKAITPKPTGGKSTPPPRGGGLDHAIAVVTEEGHRVKIIQDKIDPDTGKMKHGVGFCDWAFYDAITGDIIMHGSPDVTQNSDRCVATAPITVITLNRDGHMIAKGPHRTFVIDDSTPKAPDGALPATPRPGSSPNPVGGSLQ